MVVEIAQQFTRTSDGQQLIGIEIARLCPKPRSILDPLSNTGWIVRFDPLLAAWTRFDFHLVLGHFNPHRRNIKDLPSALVNGLDCRQVALAMWTMIHSMSLHMRWLFHHLKRLPLMTWLTSWLAPCTLA